MNKKKLTGLILLFFWGSVMPAFDQVVHSSDQFDSQNLISPLTCPLSWFFTLGLDNCPVGDWQQYPVEQPFEHGTMIWGAFGPGITGLYDDGLST